MSPDVLPNCPELGSYPNLYGKFHGHITLERSNIDYQSIQNWCKQRKGAKLTEIILNDFIQEQMDRMITLHFYDPVSGAGQRIGNSLYSAANELEREGFQLSRIKLEHEQLWPSFTSYNYGEMHLKLQIPADDYYQKMELLQLSSPNYNFHLSINPREQKNNQIIQFANKRFYDGSSEDAERWLKSVKEFFAENNIPVVNLHKETIVFDTNQELDRWWIFRS